MEVPRHLSPPRHTASVKVKEIPSHTTAKDGQVVILVTISPTELVHCELALTAHNVMVGFAWWPSS